MASKVFLKIIVPLTFAFVYMGEHSMMAVANREQPHSSEDLQSFRHRINLQRSSLQQQQNETERPTANLTRQALKQVRYDIVKKQILRKLQMTTEPRLQGVVRPAVQPLLVAAEMAENATHEDNVETVGQEAVEKTESIVIYPSTVETTCYGIVPYPCIQLQFRLAKDVGVESFASSELWLHKMEPRSIFQLTELTFIENDVVEAYKDIYRDIPDDQNTGYQHDSQMTKYNLPSDVVWFNSQTDYMLTIQIKCLDECHMHGDGNSIIEQTNDKKPFLVIRTVTTKGPTRNRRSVDCVEGKPGCCRETFYLNFSEVGWDNWILHPEGYYANFCRGRCINDLSNMRFYHSAVLISYIQDNEDIAAEMGLNMCCTPSAMSPVSIIYMNDEGLIYHKSIENMKVEACDCA